jgi:hypothetical protein
MVYPSKTDRFNKSFGYNLIFGRKLSEWIRDRFERTIYELNLYLNPQVKVKELFKQPGLVLSLQTLIPRVLSAKN